MTAEFIDLDGILCGLFFFHHQVGHIVIRFPW